MKNLDSCPTPTPQGLLSRLGNEMSERTTATKDEAGPQAARGADSGTGWEDLGS